MKASLNVVLGLILSLTWATVSYAESDSTGQTGETQSSCEVKTDAKIKVLTEEGTEGSAQKQEPKGKSSAGKAQ